MEAVMRGMVPESGTEWTPTRIRRDWPYKEAIKVIIITKIILKKNNSSFQELRLSQICILNLFQLEDSSCADVTSRKNLHRSELPRLVQLHQLHPQLQMSGHLAPPAKQSQEAF